MPSAGLLILIAITIESYYLGIIALLSAIIGTLVAKFGGGMNRRINQGLLGYNSVLTGMALASFLRGPYMWIIALVGSAIAAIFTATMYAFYEKNRNSHSYLSLYYFDMVYSSGLLQIKSD